MKKVLLIFITALIVFNPQTSYAQKFYNIDSIQKVELFFHQTNWDYLLDTAKQGSEETYLLADSVRVNGETFDSVGVKYKGNSSYSANNKKNPLHIELNTIHGKADYKGYSDIKLGNGFADPSFIREPLTYEILRNYMDAPHSNFANLWINGEYFGVYNNTEAINKDFLSQYNYPSENALVKCNPKMAGPGGSTSNLAWVNSDSSSYKNFYEIKSKYGWKDLVRFIDTLNNKSAAIEQILDIDKTLWMHAVNDVFVNMDSYTGQFAQNYYLYRDGNGRFAPVMWDFNMSFGGFPLSFGGGSGLTAMQQLIPLYQATATNRPLISKLLANDRWKKMYMAHLRTLNEENFKNADYVPTAESMMAIIKDEVNLDTKKFFTTANFTNSLDQTAAGGVGGGTVGIRQLMAGRATFLNTQADYIKIPPALATPTVNPAAPTIGNNATFNAQAVGATYVRLGYRIEHDLPFTYVEMFDDGNHNDGAAGDGNFGNSISIESVLTEYFVYAENADAGIFSPRRAEHEFHVLTAQAPQLQPGDVVINEFLADNKSTNTDPANQYDDWIELYNNSTVERNLTGIFLSDSYQNPKKWAFPTNTKIAPHSYLLVWADGDGGQTGLHANFKLANNGEKLALTTADGLTRLDSIEFAAQSPDVSMQRCPNGTGAFTLFTPTPLATNCIVPTVEISTKNNALRIFPNPTDAFLEIEFLEKTAIEPLKIQCLNSMGQLIFEKTISSVENLKINVADWSAGLYFLKTSDGRTARFVKM